MSVIYENDEELHKLIDVALEQNIMKIGSAAYDAAFALASGEELTDGETISFEIEALPLLLRAKQFLHERELVAAE